MNPFDHVFEGGGRHGRRHYATRGCVPDGLGFIFEHPKKKLTWGVGTWAIMNASNERTPVAGARGRIADFLTFSAQRR